MAVAGEQEQSADLVVLDELEQVGPFAREAGPRRGQAVRLPFAAGGEHLDLGLRREQFAFEPGQLLFAEMRFRAVVRRVVRVAMVTAVEHEEVNVAARELEIDAGIVLLTERRIRPEHLEGAERLGLARGAFVRGLGRVIVVVPDGVLRHAAAEVGVARQAALPGEGGKMFRRIGGVAVVIVPEHEQRVEVRARREIGPRGGGVKAVLAHARDEREPLPSARTLGRRGGEGRVRARRDQFAIHQHGVKIFGRRRQVFQPHGRAEEGGGFELRRFETLAVGQVGLAPHGHGEQARARGFQPDLRAGRGHVAEQRAKFKKRAAANGVARRGGGLGLVFLDAGKLRETNRRAEAKGQAQHSGKIHGGMMRGGWMASSHAVGAPSIARHEWEEFHPAEQCSALQCFRAAAFRARRSAARFHSRSPPARAGGGAG